MSLGWLSAFIENGRPDDGSPVACLALGVVKNINFTIRELPTGYDIDMHAYHDSSSRSFPRLSVNQKL